ncbi:MAG: hypothetical protein K2K40_08290 [Paramuribaculum sp.]|nr:hypothetical protein [Paramuribaculum sp.]
MKHIVTVIVIIASLLLCVGLAACGGDRDIERQLDRADAMMDSIPAEALIILQEIDRSRLGDADAARHALLLSQAYDKTAVDIADDSLIAIARDYYLTHPGRRDMLARAYYYSGVVAFNAADYPESIYYLSLADTLAAGVADHRLRGMANAMLAWSNSELLDLENEYRHAERALRFLTLAGDSARISRQKLYVAICHLQLNRPAEALAMLDSPGCEQSAVTRASSLVELGRLDEFRAMMELNPALSNSSKLMADYARQLVGIGNLVEADSALTRALRNAKNSSDTASCMGVKAELLKSRGEWQQYASIVERRLAVLNADNRRAVRNADAGSRAEALHFLATNEKNELRMRNLTLTLWGITGTLLAVVMVYILLSLIRKKRRSDKLFEQQIEDQKRDIKASKAYQTTLEQKITEQEASSAILIEKCDKLLQTNEAFVNARHKYNSETLQGSVANLRAELTSLCKKYRDMVNDGQEVRGRCREEIMSVYTPGCKGLFECYVDKTHGNIIAMAREAGFDDEDIDMAVLDKLGFSNEEISILLDIISSGAATTRKSRLRTKLKSAGINI